MADEYEAMVESLLAGETGENQKNLLCCYFLYESQMKPSGLEPEAPW
jgi:hypothetical protein